MVCEHEYMNMSPLPPIIELATALSFNVDNFFLAKETCTKASPARLLFKENLFVCTTAVKENLTSVEEILLGFVKQKAVLT
jgi:hypothetical protein